MGSSRGKWKTGNTSSYVLSIAKLYIFKSPAIPIAREAGGCVNVLPRIEMLLGLGLRAADLSWSLGPLPFWRVIFLFLN